MTLVDSAREWVQAGYFVYPVNLTLNEKGKKDVEFPGNWRDSTNKLEDLPHLFSNATGLAIDTGKSGVVVVDIDTGNGKDGRRNLTEAGVELPSTPMTAGTWSGGRHGFFKQPAERVGSGQNRPVKDVDFRGDGGVVFAAPTVVLQGSSVAGSYTVTSILPVERLPVLPESYASRLRSKPAEKTSGVFTGFRTSTTLREDQERLLTRYVEDDLAVIRNATDGSRNEALGRTTLLLADRCFKLGVDYSAFEDMVLEAYEESGGTDRLQAIEWCRSAARKAEASPMDVPRTSIDELADRQHSQMVANRLARARVNGATAKLVDESSFVDWTAAPAPGRYWVSGLLPLGELVILYGKPEAGKTFLALDWAMSVASGSDVFGRKTDQGKVWFMAGEGNTRITARMHAWIEHTRIKPDPSMLRLLNHVPDLMSEQVIEDLAQKIAEHEVDLVVLDTLGRAMAVGGGDISSPPDAAMALRSMQALSKYRKTTTPVAIHHPIKDGGMAGAYNLLAGVDVALHAEVDESGVGVLKFAKNKDGEKTTVCEYRWIRSAGSAVLVPVYGGADDGFDDERRRFEDG